MKNFYAIILISVICLPAVCLAQEKDGEKRRTEFDHFKKKRVEYISNAMKLNEKEAEVFLPLCLELWEKKFEIDRVFRHKMREFMKDEREGKEHKEEDYCQIVEIFAEKQLNEAKLNKEYMQKFLKILPAEKVFLFQGAEQDFLREMLNHRRKSSQK
ncbi:MAG: hypothetical protein LBJ17_02035 [Dysgonamonadaceae bacterium]|jgi:hypothetical protein|nr:hypothetical protein [Dysgonamonadaceae bacterium]